MNDIKTCILTIDDLELFKVIPNGKRPAVKGGFYSAKKNFDVVRAYMHGFNVGFRMEPMFIAIDMDEDDTKGYHGIQVIDELEKKLGQLPQTYTQETPRGGIHKIYLASGFTNKPIGKITPAVDIKYSGFVLFQGSQINGKYYKAIDGCLENGKLYFSSLPDSWIKYIESSTSSKKSNEKIANVYRPVVIEGNFKQMYDNCLFVKRCVDCSSTISELEWHLFARLLNHFDKGEELYINYSRNHADFDLEKCRQKFQYAKKYPVNCRLISKDSDACQKCNNLYKEIRHE